MTKTAFTQSDVRRAVKGALDAGLPIGSVEVTKGGTIRILPPKEDTKADEVDKWFKDAG